jgi:N-acetylglucosaminyldiphosphoundecaprenol N-acetyl-beta-D-mannosaminyltransferase
LTRKIRFLEVEFDAMTVEEAADQAERFILEGRPRRIAVLNVALYVQSRSDQRLQAFFRASDVLLPDGMGIYYASRLLGDRTPGVSNAVFLMFELLRRAERNGYGVFLLGTKPEILEAVERRLRATYPGLLISGSHHGYFAVPDEPEIVSRIARSGARILFLALSTPKREEFLIRHQHEMGVPLTVPVGGAFDVVAGVYRLAPGWIRMIGLEWLFRLIQEPRRLWKRYLVTNSLFAVLVIRALLARRQ